jgi:hypothetical protein
MPNYGIIQVLKNRTRNMPALDTVTPSERNPFIAKNNSELVQRGVVGFRLQFDFFIGF